MKKVITVSISASFEIEDAYFADEIKREMDKFILKNKETLKASALTYGGKFEIKEQYDSWPNDTCRWCEKDFKSETHQKEQGE